MISSMCTEAWGCSSYALALIELDAEKDIKSELIVGIPNMVGDGFSKQVIQIEYQWKPPSCTTCKVFNHESDHCPKLPKKVIPVEVHQEGGKAVQHDEDGFTKVSRRKRKGKAGQQERQIEGVKLSKPKPKIVYKAIPKQNSPSNVASTSKANGSQNSFEALADPDDQGDESGDDIECAFDVEGRFNIAADSEGASTPVSGMPHV